MKLLSHILAFHYVFSFHSFTTTRFLSDNIQGCSFICKCSRNESRATIKINTIRVYVLQAV